MKLDLSDVYDAAYTREVELLREAVDHTVLGMLARHLLDADGGERPAPPLRFPGPEAARTAATYRQKLLAYGRARGDLAPAVDGRLQATTWPLRRPPSLADLPEQRRVRELLAAVADIAPLVLEGKDGFAALESRLGLKAMFDLWEWLMVSFAPKRPCNILLGRVLITALREAAAPLTVLEGGAGVGAVLRHALASPALAPLLPRLGSYLFTDISAVLLERGKSWLRQHGPPELFARMVFSCLDLDGLPGRREAPLDHAGSVDLILLEHVLYDLRDLGAMLRHFHWLLRPGGHLAFTMSFRGAPDQFLACEFLQSTLHSYHRAVLDPPRRHNVGYPTLEEWGLSLEAAGFTTWQAIPGPVDHARWPFGGIVATRTA
jgi:SAM-dependent methyltransferase